MSLTGLLSSRGHELKKKTAQEYSTHCPFCGGQDRFCVWPEKGNYWCRQCGAKGDEIQLLRDLDGMGFPEAAEKVGKQTSADPKPKKTASAKITQVYNYTNEENKTLFQVCRFDPKDFRQRRHGENGDWVWNVKNTRLVLYHLSEVLQSEDVFFVEGEKDADALAALGFTATTNPMGAGKLPGQCDKHNILAPLHGKRVGIIPDNDKAGKEHAQSLASMLYGKAREVRLVELPGLEQKEDTSDFIRKVGDDAKVQLIELFYSVKPWRPPRVFFNAEDLLAEEFEFKTPIVGQGILAQGGHMLIAGETGVGKSLLRQELALHLIMGWDWLGFKVPRSRGVAIFQYENSESTEQKRLKIMCEGFEITKLPPGKLKYIERKNRINLSLKGERDKLMQLVKEANVEVIIYDCLSNLHAAKENDNVQMRDILDTLSGINANLGTSCIVIHHFGKPGEENKKSRYRARGASSIMDWAETALSYTVKEHESKVIRQINFDKIRDGPDIKPLLVERDEHFLLTVIDDDTMCPPGQVREILDDLGGRVEKQGELIEAIIKEVSCTRKSAKKYIRRAVEMMTIFEVDHGNGRRKEYNI